MLKLNSVLAIAAESVHIRSMNNKLAYVSVSPERVVVGSCSEDADMGNPHGLRWGNALVVIVEMESGARFQHNRVFRVSEDMAAHRLADRIKAAGEINAEHWQEVEPAYGSKEWQLKDSDRNFRHQIARMAQDWEEAERWA